MNDSMLTGDLTVVKEMYKHIRADLNELSPIWLEFTESMGVTPTYWLQYLEMVEILKRYVQAERSGKWQGHIDEVKNMLPYIVAAKHYKYMICLPLYINDTSTLQENHPQVYHKFMEGQFTVN